VRVRGSGGVMPYVGRDAGGGGRTYEVVGRDWGVVVVGDDVDGTQTAAMVVCWRR
jgi:hypothetical protein